MKRTEKRFIGDIGEELACRFLMKRGFKILEQNYLKKWGEIDIVARKPVRRSSGQEESLHFVEVKTVSVSSETLENPAGEGYRPEDQVHPWKLKRLHRAIETYLLERNVSPETPWQVDVITVRLDRATKRAKIELLENVM